VRVSSALLGTALLAACDKTPPEVKKLEETRLEPLRQFVADEQKECTHAGPAYKPTDYGAYASDPEVLNVQITCKPVVGLGLAVNHDPMRPAPSGDKMATPWRIGKSGEEDDFPRETARVPSWLTAEPGAIDVCVASGHPDDEDFTEVCVAFRAPR
jgi:hypothetical protein